MTADARFEDAHEAPLHLKAETAEDLTVISALLQDAVLPASEMRWEPKRRRFTMLVNRFRWEDAAAARRHRRPFERVRALLVVGDVLRVASQGLGPRDPDTVLALLALGWEPGEDGTGRLVVTLAGDGQVALDAECLEVTLKDVTRPYAAPARRAPAHPAD